MSKFQFILVFAGCLLLTACATGPRLPNIIIIFADDLGYADLSCFGADKIKTPHLDGIAENGIRFTDFYVSQAVCSASRASLLTGCYSHRVGILGALGPVAQHGISADEQTIPELLKQKDYATAAVGKWHLGHHPEFLPTSHGFDSYFGLPYSNDMWPKRPERIYYPDLPLIEDTTTIQIIEEQSLLTTWYAERSVDFINQNKDKPFFLYLAHSMPHVPLYVSEKFAGKSEQGIYGDVIEEIDWSVGQILQTLRELQLEENTLVIFTSDNGPWLNYGTHSGSAAPLREGKGTAWEGGVREPFVAQWPARIQAGLVCSEPAMTIDILPTIAEITGTRLSDNKIDGKSFLPLLTGEADAVSPQEAYYFYYDHGLKAVRSGDWKLYFPHKYRSLSGRAGGDEGLPVQYDIVATDTVLYNLREDIGEQVDVKDMHPDVAARLVALADSVRPELGDANVHGSGLRPPGYLASYVAEKRPVEHAAVDAKLSLTYPASEKYPTTSEFPLVDGVRGTSSYRDRVWQGFEENDLLATITFDEVVEVSSITIGLLKDLNSWIFLPSSIELEYRQATGGFQSLASIPAEKLSLDDPMGLHEVTHDFAPTKVNEVRVLVDNIGRCPDWHQGAGGRAWIFVDEIELH